MGFDGSNIKKEQIKRNEAGGGKKNEANLSSLKQRSGDTSGAFSFLTYMPRRFITFVVFLFIFITPALYSLVTIKKDESRELVFEKATEKRVAANAQFMSELNLSDHHLLQCAQNAIRERSNVHPSDTGGIDHFRELTMLTCMDESITTIKGISALEGLTYLNLDHNGIEDIYELRHLQKLETLSLLANPIRNIISLQEMAALRKVTLPDLPETYCYDVLRAVQQLKSNVENIKCKGKWTIEIEAISGKKMSGNPLTDIEEKLYSDYEHNLSFMPQK